MNLVVATIPEDPAELSHWLERRLVGLELDGLVAELAAIHGSATARPSLAQVLGSKLEQVRSSGLSCLSSDQIRQLLTRPLLLLDLQEQVLTAGGVYWDQVARTIPMMHLKVEEGRKFLPREATAGAKPRSVRLTPAASVPTPAAPKERTRPAYGIAMLASLATAAALLLAFGLWQMNQPGARTGALAWGWQKPGVAKDDVKPAAYLEGLASAADEWFATKPADADALAQRIGEMRSGCSRLILASHRPLSPNDRDWLLEKCKAWASDFDKTLTDLEASRDVAKAQQRMDETVQRLSKALRERARQA